MALLGHSSHYYCLYSCLDLPFTQKSVSLGSSNSSVGAPGSVTALAANDLDVGSIRKLELEFTNLPADLEEKLRKFVQPKAQLGSKQIFPEGRFSTIPTFSQPQSARQSQVPPCCFYCLLQMPAQRDYVLCFLAETEDPESLELYRPNIVAYVENFAKMLTAAVISGENGAISSEEKSKLTEYLSGWYSTALEFTTRALAAVGPELDVVLYASLLGKKVNILGSDEAKRRDVQRFIESVSVLDLFHVQTEKGTETAQSTQSTREITINLDDPTKLVSTKETNEYCHYFSSVFVKCLLDPVRLRKVIEMFRLRTIKELNSAKRLLDAARTDNYAFYTLYRFLRNNNNGDVLLHLLLAEYTKADDPQTTEVLEVIRDYLKQQSAVAFAVSTSNGTSITAGASQTTPRDPLSWVPITPLRSASSNLVGSRSSSSGAVAMSSSPLPPSPLAMASSVGPIANPSTTEISVPASPAIDLASGMLQPSIPAQVSTPPVGTSPNSSNLIEL